VRTLIIARGLNPTLQECVQCGWTDRSADPVCPVCRGARRDVTFEEVLPGLLRKQEAQIEVVSGEAAERLKAMDGMAAWLRQARSRAAKTGR